MSLIPSFNDAPSPYGPSGLNGPAMGSAVPSDNYAFLDRGAAPAYDPSPRSGVGATPGAVAGGSPARAQPFNYQVSVLDLSALNFQHRPELGAPAAGISGVRPFDPYAIKRDFPILHQNVNGRPLIWLDNAATTQKPQSVIDRISYFYEHENSNIHRAAHTLAARSTDAYEAARSKVRAFINAPSPDSVIFVRGTTEGINLIAKAWGGRNVNEGDEIVVTQLEHHANIVPWQQLAAEKGAKLRVAPVDNTGQIILEEFEKLLNPKTRIVSVSQVSNALGTITPAQDMVAMAHRHGAIAVVDGAQSVSHMPVDVQALDADFFVFSGHKMFGPTGIGVVYGRPSVLESMPPWQGGGNMISDVTFEKTTFHGPPLRFEAGTGNIADAVGLGAAIDYLMTIGMSNIAAYEHELLGYADAGPYERARVAHHRHGAREGRGHLVCAGRVPLRGCRQGARPRRHCRALGSPLRAADPAPLRPRERPCGRRWRFTIRPTMSTPWSMRCSASRPAAASAASDAVRGSLRPRGSETETANKRHGRAGGHPRQYPRTLF